jgi:hypothetical protein
MARDRPSAPTRIAEHGVTMTFQVQDRFILRGEEYVVLGQQGDFPTPWKLGVRMTRRAPTSYIRGHYGVYASDGEGVVLRDLFVYPEGDPPSIRGVAAARPSDEAHLCVYRGIDVPCDGDTRFVLARGRAHDDFRSSLGRSPCAFETVVELGFRGGKCAGERDHSAAVRAIRDRVDALRALEIPPGWGRDSRKALEDLEWSFTILTEHLTR